MCIRDSPDIDQSLMIDQYLEGVYQNDLELGMLLPDQMQKRNLKRILNKQKILSKLITRT